MKNPVKYLLLLSMGMIVLSSCTGDKGIQKNPDSIRIDTTTKQKQQPPAKAKDSGATLMDSLQTDTSKSVKKP